MATARTVWQAALGLAVATAVLGVAASTAPARSSPTLRVGLVDNAAAYYGEPGSFFPVLRELRAQLLRVHLNWGGRLGVARRRPAYGANPADPAYDWRAYDRIVLDADAAGAEVVFTIFGTPPWANGGAVPTRAPRNPVRLAEFAEAAATRYSGSYRRADGVRLPAVRLWTAWNEPNLKIGLVPQWRRVGNRWVIQSAIDYARICNAIVDGIRATELPGRRIACGVTSPHGNNNPRGEKPSVSPLAFLRAMKAAGAAGFDAYAHHPYALSPQQRPSMAPRARFAVSLGNLDVLVREVTRLYGPLPLWITEYGYQTNPPDPYLGVSWAAQARYLREAVALARANKRIEMLIWFLLRDEPLVERWQSGLMTDAGRRKPAFAAFQQLARGQTP